MFTLLQNHPTFTFCHFTSYHFTFLPAVQHKGSYFILSNIVIFLKIQSTLMSMGSVLWF